MDMIRESMQALDEVIWDRFIEHEGQVLVYGWVNRDKDSYKDFVLLGCDSDLEEPWLVTSSAANHEDWCLRLFNRPPVAMCRSVSEMG